MLTALFAWLTATITNYFNNKIKDKKGAGYAVSISTIILGAVQSVFQTFVDTLKKSGKFDDNAKAEAKERALTIIRSQLTTELKNYIIENYGDLEEYLKNQVEAVIYQLKK